MPTEEELTHVSLNPRHVEGRLGPCTTSARSRRRADSSRFSKLPIIEELAAAPGFIRRFSLNYGPSVYLITFWRTVVDTKTFASIPKHREIPPVSPTPGNRGSQPRVCGYGATRWGWHIGCQGVTAVMLICGPAPVGELAGGAEPDAGLALVDPVGQASWSSAWSHRWQPSITISDAGRGVTVRRRGGGTGELTSRRQR